ncbi:SCO family protein [Pseudobdellovibrio exovorus]|uniref:Thioredoxin domain-containing protein n=1 Tax=Pseudobdellovibrio exovorus JSS TaxID=1184267 RepID=M4V580_9BACT|nr:SCO family protein [Pseudobdellovibrio exovorus]AGH94472.1 hypothetical protein A11Q_252 [Pseudobdellovibrio exovorus JSS]
MTQTKKSPLSVFLKVLSITALVFSLVIGGFIFYINYTPAIGGDFDLTYRNQDWKFSEQAKDLNLLYIGYAKCPDICPMALSYAGYAFKNLTPAELEKVQLLFLSVDRDNDLPDDVANYAAQFFPTFLGLSGSSREQIDKTVSLFQASYMVEENEKSYLGYSIAHTDKLYFLNKKGIVIHTIQSPRSSESIIETIKENL